ncbi:STAS-like domain-containing protein [Pectobacterium aroidearum]|uniref:STAS-like domain-containing protein n=1 Tax=Pectobacterium aroidearum TaxID=1201031 RepID=UPI0032EEBA73
MIKEINYINVADDFSDDPFGRYPDDGEFNATKFRRTLLIPALKNLKDGEKLTIDFSGVSIGLGSSFIEEVFGGLIRDGFDSTFVNDRIIYKFPMSFYEIQAKKFIAMAKAEKEEQKNG